MIMIGGIGSIYGAVLGTLFIVLMENLFIPLFEDGLSKTERPTFLATSLTDKAASTCIQSRILISVASIQLDLKR